MRTAKRAHARIYIIVARLAVVSTFVNRGATYRTHPSVHFFLLLCLWCLQPEHLFCHIRLLHGSRCPFYMIGLF